ncbi:MAG: ABC transporter substrate-binding protein [Leptolyngbyaceae cyanobacterium CRU_2_3]|nr:ABC transporter substrate-binding protein [Leptolyngbyaceae cyanobacterium CRU_2_3]
MVAFSRRQFLTAAGSALTAKALSSCSTPSSALRQTTGTGASAQAYYVGHSDTPETTTAKLGFLSVVSGAPLIIAKAKGFFDKYGMPDVRVLKQASWATLRDQLVLGSGDGGLDGGHILSSMVYLLATGEISFKRPIPVYLLARLNLNGQGISVPNTYQNLKLGLDSTPLKSIIAQKKSLGETVRCAVPFPRCTADFFLRWWLEKGGIDPYRDISLVTMPPPQMVANMRAGSMEAFSCVDPWHQRLVKQGVGYSTVTTGELWNNHPEKAFIGRADWVDKYPNAARAMLAAVLEAQIWCDQPENKEEMVKILAERQWLDVPANVMLDRLQGKFDYGNGRVVTNSPHVVKYWRDNASYPYKSHDLWFLIEDMRWGYRSPDFDAKSLIDAVNREDLWREAATLIGQKDAIPSSTSRGIEKFFNGLEFDPENPQIYLNSSKAISL